MIKNIEKYVDRYNICQRIKNCMEVLAGKLMVNKIQERLYMYLMVDFITKLLLVVEKDAILVVYDKLSKIAYFVATIKGTLVEGLT